jgi:CheY-like chemotaxis protein
MDPERERINMLPPPLRVLVAEDEILIRKYIALLLSSLGCTIVAETSYGQDAVHLTKEKLPQLVIMDIGLKGDIDGIQAAKEIGKQFSIPILFVSAYDYQQQIEEQEAIPNLLGYLKKPVDVSELKSFLDKLTVPLT